MQTPKLPVANANTTQVTNAGQLKKKGAISANTCTTPIQITIGQFRPSSPNASHARRQAVVTAATEVSENPWTADRDAVEVCGDDSRARSVRDEEELGGRAALDTE